MYKCALCLEQTDPYIKCAFQHNGYFDYNNWNCATINALANISDEKGNTFFGNDQTIEIIALEDSILVLSRYKRRGKVDQAIILTPLLIHPKVLTLDVAINVLKHFGIE